MENPIRRNLFEIGDCLRKIGDNMCQQAKSQEKLDYLKMMNPPLLDLFKTIHNFPIELNEWREDIEKERKKRSEPQVYPKGYVETYEELCAFWDEQEAYNERFYKNRSEINDIHNIIYALIHDNLFPTDSPNPTFTFNEALWKIAWQLRKLEDLFPYEQCGTVGLEETEFERE